MSNLKEGANQFSPFLFLSTLQVKTPTSFGIGFDKIDFHDGVSVDSC